MLHNSVFENLEISSPPSGRLGSRRSTGESNEPTSQNAAMAASPSDPSVCQESGSPVDSPSWGSHDTASSQNLHQNHSQSSSWQSKLAPSGNPDPEAPLQRTATLPQCTATKRDVWWFLSWFFDSLIALLPLCFLALAVTALFLDGHPAPSPAHDGIFQAIQLGPTVFPILFTAIVGKFFSNLSHWRLEQPKGIRLGELEQIFGSQSPMGAVSTAFAIRSGTLVTVSIIILWLLSPLGGQSSLRLLQVGQVPVRSTVNVYYANPDYASSWYTGASGTASAENSVSMLYSNVLFSVPSTRAECADPWGRPKIPHLPRRVIETSDHSWQTPFDDEAHSRGEAYTSLLGIQIQGLRDVGNGGYRPQDPSTQFRFSINTSYVDMNCEMLEGHEREQNPVTTFTADFHQISNKSWYWSHSQVGNRLSFNNSCASGFTCEFECDMRRIPVEAEILCGHFPSTGCRVQQQRLVNETINPELFSDLDRQAFALTPELVYQTVPYGLDNITLTILLEKWPNVSKVYVSHQEATATVAFLDGKDNLYGGQRIPDWTGIAPNLTLISRRMTTLFNTLFQATINPWNATKIDFKHSVDRQALDGDDDTVILNLTTSGSGFGGRYNNIAKALSTREQAVYVANLPWCVTLIITGLTLQLLALGSLWLRGRTNGPDVLGFVSSLTRDNAHFPRGTTGSALDGGARTRAWRGLRVQAADVLPSAEVGHIVFRPVPQAEEPGEGGSGGETKEGPRAGWRGLSDGRVYR